jgi:ubiquinone/menaquinone biosynthesis C-methylase UbiE
MPRPRLRLRHALPIAVIAAARLADAERTRRRLRALPAVGEPAPGTPSSQGVPGAGTRWVLVRASGVAVSPDTRRAAESHAAARGLDVLDLVPGDLARAVVRNVDPRTYRADRLALGRGAGCAVLLSPEVAGRIGGTVDDDNEVDPAELAALLAEAKRCAPTTTDLATIALDAPATASVPTDDGYYAKVIAEGVDKLLEPRRDTCPWCGKPDIALVMRCRDEMQHKPGVFHIDRCGNCGHIFQNPRLSPEGLDFYYRDFYGGASAERFDELFALSPDHYRDRAASLEEVLGAGQEPERWLDVGAARGHFCLVAKERFPTTSFEGLDMDPGITDAERRGWIDQAHVGGFPELSHLLAEQFDVVSLYHCLEHTREPRDELAAAARVLRVGGHLAVEVPDPACFTRQLFGRWWFPWFQPQHQHFVTLGNLCGALDELGFDVVKVERQQVHQPVEVAMGSWLVLGHLGPATDDPWRPPATSFDRARHQVAKVVGVPVILTGFLADRLLSPVISRLQRGSNTYRVTARRRPNPEPTERERAVVDHCERHGYPATLLRARATFADDGEELAGRDRIQEALRLQVALHHLPVEGLAGVVPEVWPAEEVQRFDRSVLGEECAWLDRQLVDLTPGDHVLCHGSFQPMLLVDGRRPDDDESDEHTLVTGWGRAVLAEPELDVAYTLLAFWSGHLFADTRPKSTMLRMIREPLAASYRRSYAQSRPLDADRLRFWQAFHALRDVALAENAFATVGDPLAADGGEMPTPRRPASLTAALRRHFWHLAGPA